MHQLLLFMMLAGITLHASFGCGLYHGHAHVVEHRGAEVEAAHEHDCHEESGHHDHDAAPSGMPCGAPTSPNSECGVEPCVFAGAVKVNVTDSFVAKEIALPAICSPVALRVTLVHRFENAAIGRSPPIRSHLLLGVLLL
jgi:hypothetical protein